MKLWNGNIHFKVTTIFSPQLQTYSNVSGFLTKLWTCGASLLEELFPEEELLEELFCEEASFEDLESFDEELLSLLEAWLDSEIGSSLEILEELRLFVLQPHEVIINEAKAIKINPSFFCIYKTSLLDTYILCVRLTKKIIGA